MKIKYIEWYVSRYTLTYHNPHSRTTITKDFDQEEELIEYINANPRIRQYTWGIEKKLHAFIEEELGGYDYFKIFNDEKA